MTHPPRIPLFWLWPLLAPVFVAGGLLGLRSVPVVFLLYHLVLCLALPAWISHRQGLSLREHAARLGLARRGLAVGGAMGAAMAVIIVAVFAAAPDLYVDSDTLRQALAAWGVGPRLVTPMLLFLLLVNSPAEELFWRGWLQAPGRPPLLRSAALIALFASYHGVTSTAMSPGPWAVAVKLLAVSAAAAFWTWSRWRWDSVWVAVLSHWGAAVGYTAVGWWILR